MDAIYNVSIRETPLLSRLAMVPVKANYVEWLTDSFADAETNVVNEGIAFTAKDCTTPSRAVNLTQIMYESGQISDRQRAVAHAGFDDPFAYQEFKKVVKIKKDMELAIVKGSAVSGTTGATSSQLGGFMNILSTNKTDMSGVTMTEIYFNDVLELVWNNTEVYPDSVYVGPKLKRTISLYSTKVTRNVDAGAKRQILAVENYDSEFGPLSIHFHRNLASAADGANEMLIIDPNWYATGWLQPLRREVLTRDGKRDRFQISAELTLLYRNEAAGACVTNWRPYITS